MINNGLAVFHVPLEESFEPFPSVTAERIEPDGPFFSTDTAFSFTGDLLKCPAGLRDEIKKNLILLCKYGSGFVQLSKSHSRSKVLGSLTHF